LKGREAADNMDKLANAVEVNFIESQIDCCREITEESRQNVDIQAIGRYSS
jgi:hypothetical protein